MFYITNICIIKNIKLKEYEWENMEDYSNIKFEKWYREKYNDR